MVELNAATRTRSQAIRARLDHPVIDGDGHVIELIPVFADYLREHGHGDVVDATPMFTMQGGLAKAQGELSQAELRAAGMVPAGWTTPTDTDYLATITSAPRYYERLGEAGIDFAVLYPTIGLPLTQVEGAHERVTLCRLYNEFMAEQYGPYPDRFTMAAAIPMHTPEEAVEGLRHARALGAKVGLIPSYVRRPRLNEEWGQDSHAGMRPSGFGYRGWLDTFGLDSHFDYDPVWAEAIALGMPLAVHSPGMGFSDRQSPTSFVYNGVGHFAAAGTALAKSLFLGGVTRRFPELRVAVLEGGVAVGVETYIRLVSFWHERGTPGLDRLDPANVDRDRLAALYRGERSSAGRLRHRDAGAPARAVGGSPRRLRGGRYHVGGRHP